MPEQGHRNDCRKDTQSDLIDEAAGWRQRERSGEGNGDSLSSIANTSDQVGHSWLTPTSAKVLRWYLEGDDIRLCTGLRVPSL
ncbi:hypothetical protein TGRH88_024050 [Toxoplasma gondii]|uniref:Uncharacterized protein n=1 Tax=Toxoplasma gondii TaxID=5811 RepID=A0A7J6KAX4_TOXGO|nr:hypothetical protein TGRH88_024050 [Toxoplasma gondii]